MPHSFEYATVRVVPRVEREEFLNVGVIVFCAEANFLDARIELDERRLRAFAPRIDVELVREHLESIPRLCRGDDSAIGQLPLRERFRWLVSPRNTILQTSPAHAGLCDQPVAWLERLLDRMVRTP